MQKNCLACGNIFHKKNTESQKYWKSKKYCSSKCSLIFTQVRKQKNCYSFPKGHKTWNKGTKGICKPNSGSFKKGQISPNKGRKYPELSGENNPMWKEKTKKNCITCNKELILPPWRKNARFCSHSCYHKWHIGKNSPVWTDNYRKSFRQRIMELKEYKDWRFKVFKRDGFTCRECLKYSGVEAHHIKSMSSVLRENKVKTIEDARNCKELWDIKNGITLCEECHRKTDSYLKKVK